MHELKEKWGVSAWKTYTQYRPGGRGYFLSDDVGIRFIERARKFGVKNIAVHKGLPFGSQSYAHSQCSDIGVVAKRFPDANFLIYHSGFVTGVREEGSSRGRFQSCLCIAACSARLRSSAMDPAADKPCCAVGDEGRGNSGKGGKEGTRTPSTSY